MLAASAAALWQTDRQPSEAAIPSQVEKRKLDLGTFTTSCGFQLTFFQKVFTD